MVYTRCTEQENEHSFTVTQNFYNLQRNRRECQFPSDGMRNWLRRFTVGVLDACSNFYAGIVETQRLLPEP